MFLKTLITLLLISSVTYAQKAFIFRTQNEFLDDKPVRAEIELKRHSFSNGEWVGPTLYNIKVPKDELLDRGVQYNFFAIEYHDSLFLNCYHLLDIDGYANVLLRGNNYLYFVTVPSQLKAHRKLVRQMTKRHPLGKEANQNEIAAGFIGGAVGGAAAGGFEQDKQGIRFNYIYDMNTGVTDILTPEVLMHLLEKRPDLLTLYKQSNMPDDDGSYYWYLSKLFNLE